MKTMNLLLMGILLPLMIQANDDVYLQKMQQSVEQVNSASTITHYQASANTFERISKVEADKWQPMYYAAYSYILMSFQLTDSDQRDIVLDQAQHWIDIALKVAPNESELFVLQAFLYPSRIIVNPIERGMKYMGLAHETLAKAKQLNPDNPRTYYLEATFIHNSPPAMGGGIDNALPLYKTAMDKFLHFVPSSIIDPNWGENVTREALAQVNRDSASE